MRDKNCTHRDLSLATLLRYLPGDVYAVRVKTLQTQLGGLGSGGRHDRQCIGHVTCTHTVHMLRVRIHTLKSRNNLSQRINVKIISE